MAAFQYGRDSLEIVLDLVASIEYAKHRGKKTTVFVYIKRTFDNARHGVILEALKQLGIEGRLCYWISNFLKDRTIFISTAGQATASHMITRGASRGGVLSPTLFNITLIGLTRKLPKHVNLSLFADVSIWTSCATQRFSREWLQENDQHNFRMLPKTRTNHFPRKLSSYSIRL